MSDDELLELYLTGDESAISKTKEKYHKYLYKISYQILGVNEDTEECLNDTYFAAWRSIPIDRPSDIHTYLRKIARQKSIDILRKRTAGKRVDSECSLSIEELGDVIPQGNTPETELECKELNCAIERFVEMLSKTERSLFLGRYYFFDPVKDIAGYLGMSESKVKTSLFRIRKRLREYLKKEGFDI